MNGSTNLESTLREINAALRRLKVSYALVGGFAVTLRAEPRLTRDIDFVVAVKDDKSVEGIVRNLVGEGRLVKMLIEQTAVNRLSTVRLAPTESVEGVVVDLLFASCGIEAEIVSDSEVLEVLPELLVPVARKEHLIAMKLLARDDVRRPRDLEDLRGLMPALSKEEIALVHRLLALITERGYSRGRNLAGDFTELQKLFGCAGRDTGS